jgi:hypothetical protein
MTEIRHEVVVDTEIARLYDAQATAFNRVLNGEAAVLYSAGAKKNWISRHRFEWSMTLEQAITTIPRYAYEVENHQRQVADLKQAQAKLDEINKQLAAQNALYTGWSRFFLVTANNGHIHSSMHCSTCFPTTHYAWLPTLSGLTEADAVREQGPRLCSICFPSAPVEWTVGIQKPDGCPGTGTFIGYRTRYTKCPVCGAGVSVLPQSGKLRKHKAKDKS